MTTRIRRLALASLVVLCVAFGLVRLSADTFTALCGGGAGCAYQTGDKFGYQTVEKIRQNFNALLAPKYWTAASDSNLTNEVNLGALTSGLLKIAVSGSVATPSTVAAPTGAVVGTSDSQVLTGKTYDAEGTGNVLTVPIVYEVPVAACDSGNGWSNWDMEGTHNGTSGTPDYQCYSGTANGPIAFLRYFDADTNEEKAYNHFVLPADWSGAVDLKIEWYSNATTGNVVWKVYTKCIGDGAGVDAAWNAAQTITDATKGSALQLNDAALASVTTTGCTAGKLFRFAIGRDGANAGDTIASDAFLQSVLFVVRRAI